VIKLFRCSNTSTISQRLTILVALAVLPVVAFASMMVVHFARASEANEQIQMQAAARTLSFAIDREIALQQATALVLSGSRSLANDNVEGFYDRARAVLGDDPDRRIMLLDAGANIIFTTQRPYGAPMPAHSAFADAVREVVRTGQPFVSDVAIGAVSGKPVLGVYQPQSHDGAVRHIVALGFSPERISDLLHSQHLPDGWAASVIGRNGVVIGHGRPDDPSVGHPVSAGLLQRIVGSPQGFDDSVPIDGRTVEFAHIRSALTGWTLGVAVQKSVLEAPLHAALMQIASGGLLLSLIALGLALAYGRTIAAPIAALAAAAAALGRGEPPQRVRCHIKEVQRVADAVDAAAELIERRGEEREAVLRTLEQRVAERTQELQQSEAQLRQLATTDALTGLANRRRFDELFASTWRQAQREQLPVSVLMIDADHFKAYNDCYGHEAGDDCLRAIAAAIEQRALRAGDFAARYGGEEFMVLLANTDTEGALTVAQRIHAAVLELNIPHAGSPIGTVTLSIGVAMAIAHPGADGAELLRVADRNLYAAKHAGRDRIEAGDLVELGGG
jgi:diguanylate cyclase (GGDEF)-like protein